GQARRGEHFNVSRDQVPLANATPARPQGDTCQTDTQEEHRRWLGNWRLSRHMSSESKVRSDADVIAHGNGIDNVADIEAEVCQIEYDLAVARGIVAEKRDAVGKGGGIQPASAIESDIPACTARIGIARRPS